MRVYDCRFPVNGKPPAIEAKTPDSVNFINFQHNLRKVTLMIFTSFVVGAQLLHVFNAKQSLLVLNWTHQHFIWQFRANLSLGLIFMQFALQYILVKDLVGLYK